MPTFNVVIPCTLNLEIDFGSQMPAQHNLAVVEQECPSHATSWPIPDCSIATYRPYHATATAVNGGGLFVCGKLQSSAAVAVA